MRNYKAVLYVVLILCSAQHVLLPMPETPLEPPRPPVAEVVQLDVGSWISLGAMGTSRSESICRFSGPWGE